MTLQNLIELAEGRDLLKSYPKADGVYIWDYKLVDLTSLELIPSNTGKAGYKDKVSIKELVQYVETETANSPITIALNELKISGVEGITVAKV
jgi:hypothetical protein